MSLNDPFVVEGDDAKRLLQILDHNAKCLGADATPPCEPCAKRHAFLDEARKSVKRFESRGEQDAYADRNLIALAFARMAHANGYRVGIRDRAEEWPILCIDLPTGQVTYHIPRADTPADLPDYPDPWDGHDLATKQARVRAYAFGGASP